MYRILIVNQHSNNRGDQAACRALIRAVKDQIPDAVFDILYADPRSAIWEDNEFVRNHNKVKILRRRNYVKLPIALLFEKLRIHRSIAGVNDILTLFRESDLVVSAPSGPGIGEIYKSREIQYLFMIWLGKFYKRKVMIYGPSMGPFRIGGVRAGIRNILRRAVLEKVDAITLREEVSCNYLRCLKLRNDNISVTLDAAVQDHIRPMSRDVLWGDLKIDRDRTIVGMTPIQPSFGGATAKASTDISTDVMAAAADYCIEQYKANIVFVPQLFGSTGFTYSSDLPVIYEVIHKMKLKDNVRIMDPFYDSDKQQAMIGAMDFFIGMRYHSIVFSTKMGVPHIGIAYQHKTTGFMKYIGLEEYAIELGSLTWDLLKQKIDQLWKDREQVKSYLVRMQSNWEMQSFRNTEKLLELVRGTG